MKDLLWPSKCDVNIYNVQLNGAKKPSVIIHTLRWMVMKGLSPGSNHFGWSWEFFCNHPNTETSTETDADHKRFLNSRICFVKYNFLIEKKILYLKCNIQDTRRFTKKLGEGNVHGWSDVAIPRTGRVPWLLHMRARGKRRNCVTVQRQCSFSVLP